MDGTCRYIVLCLAHGGNVANEMWKAVAQAVSATGKTQAKACKALLQKIAIRLSY